MYNHPYNFIEMNSVIYDMQFGFRQKYSGVHALIHLLNDKIREPIDSGLLVEYLLILTVDHDILTEKLNYYDIKGVANN